MACSESRRLQAYLEADLSLPERARLDEHLTHCGFCRQELADLQQLESLLAELAPAAPPTDFTAAAMLRARHELRRPARTPATWAAALTAASAAAAVFMFLLQFGSYQQPMVASAPHAVVADVAASGHPTAIHHASLMMRQTPLRMTSLPAARRHVVAAFPSRRHEPSFAAAYSPAPVAPPAEQAAAMAYGEATRHASGDPDLTVAALENVAVAYPSTRQAPKALLAAANLERRRGNLAEADTAYRRVLALSPQPTLTQALAHQALGDLRRQSVGDDEVALYHYTQAARALRAPATRRDRQALVVLADVERETGQRGRAAADYAAVVNSGVRSSAVEHSATALADVL